MTCWILTACVGLLQNQLFQVRFQKVEMKEEENDKKRG